MIDLRSDTFTKPCHEMRKAIYHAEIGDDCYGEDQSVLALEEKCSDLFGKDSALFMPSGTMSNQVAIKTHTEPGNEIFTHERYHVFYYESAPTSAVSGVHFNLINNPKGIIERSDLYKAMNRKPRGPLYAKPRLLMLENTVCSLGGLAIRAEVLENSYLLAKKFGMSVHLDGARIYNACVSTDQSPVNFGNACDSISMCFAKGLGAPVGSILVGTKEFIDLAKTYRKWLGGSMHQSGMMAAACMFALEKVGLSQIKSDHEHAMFVYNELKNYFNPDFVHKPDSNMLILNCNYIGVNASDVIVSLKERGILALPWDEHCIRMVFHRGVTEEDTKALPLRITDTVSELLPASNVKPFSLNGGRILQTANMD